MQAVHTAVALGIVGGLIFMVLGMALSPWALEVMGTPDDVMDYAVVYIEIYFGGMVFNLLYNMGSGILRAVGDSKRPLYFLILCTVLNLVLDLLFVLVFHWGVMGAAIATITSQAVSAILILVILMRSSDVYRVYLKEIRLDMHILRNIIQIGLPAGLQSSMYSISNIIIQTSIKRLWHYHSGCLDSLRQNRRPVLDDYGGLRHLRDHLLRTKFRRPEI